MQILIIDVLGLTIPETARQRLKERIDGWEVPVHDSPTAGCPAMVNFGEDSALKNMWDWHVDIAGTIYQQLYPAM